MPKKRQRKGKRSTSSKKLQHSEPSKQPKQPSQTNEQAHDYHSTVEWNVIRPMLTRRRARDPSVPVGNACLFLSLPYEVHRLIMSYLCCVRKDSKGRVVTKPSGRTYDTDTGIWNGYGLVNSCRQMKETAGDYAYRQIEWDVLNKLYTPYEYQYQFQQAHRNVTTFRDNVPALYLRNVCRVTGQYWEVMTFAIRRGQDDELCTDSDFNKRLCLTFIEHKDGRGDVERLLRNSLRCWTDFKPRALRLIFENIASCSDPCKSMSSILHWMNLWRSASEQDGTLLDKRTMTWKEVGREGPIVVTFHKIKEEAEEEVF